MERLLLRMFISISLYILLTLPYISLIIFNYGIDYGRYGCIIAMFITIILTPAIANYFKIK